MVQPIGNAERIQVREATESFIRRAEDMFSRRYERVPVLFDLKGRTAGMFKLIGKRASQVLYTVFMLVPFAVVPVLAVFYPVAWLSLIVLLATLSATLIVWTYRTPRELIVALQLSSLASLAWSGFILWAYVA